MKESLSSIVDYINQLFQGDEESQLVRTYSGQDSLFAAFCYVPFVSAAILVLRSENNEFVSFHARQALVLLLLGIFALLLLPSFLKLLAAAVIAFLLIFGAYKALKGAKWYFPLVTELANSIDL